MSESVFKVDYNLIRYSNKTRHLLYKDKSFSILTPWYTTNRLFVDSFGNKCMTLNASKGFNQTVKRLITHCCSLSGNPDDTNEEFSFIVPDDIRFYDAKLEQKVDIADMSQIFVPDCQISMDIKILGFNKSNKIIIKAENCAFKMEETIDFQSCSELSDY